MYTIGIDASRANVEHRTGTEWYIYNLLHQFKTTIPKSYRVILYTKEPLRKDLLPLPDNWENQVLRWPPKLLWTQLRMSLTMLLPSRRPDVLFIPAHTIPVIHSKNTIYVAHDLGFERYAELYANTYIGGRLMNAVIRICTLGRYGTSELDYHRWSMRFAVQHAAHIITISQFTKQELEHFYTPITVPVSVVYNGFNKNHDTPIFTKPSEVPYFLFIGRIEQKKNIPQLIRAFALLKQQYQIPHQLWLAGTPGYGYDEVIELINEKKLTDQVKLLGYVPQSKMNQLMNQSYAFVFPTHYEGFGIPILEALATRTLVACSDISVLHEIGGQACLYFNQQDPQSIADTLYQATQLSAVELTDLKDLGEKQVAQFSWERCANETWAIIKSGIESRLSL